MSESRESNKPKPTDDKKQFERALFEVACNVWSTNVDWGSSRAAAVELCSKTFTQRGFTEQGLKATVEAYEPLT